MNRKPDGRIVVGVLLAGLSIYRRYVAGRHQYADQARESPVDRARAALVRAAQAQLEQTRQERARQEQARQEQAQLERARQEQAWHEQARAAQARQEQTRSGMDIEQSFRDLEGGPIRPPRPPKSSEGQQQGG